MADISPQNFSENLTPEAEEFMKQMFEAGLHWGRKHSVTHPKMRPFIFSTRGDIEIIDLAKTVESFERAMEFVRETVRNGGKILMVGAQPSAKNYVKDIANRLGFPFVNERWLGGTLTNFKTLEKRIEYMKQLESKINSPEFLNYTKKERVDFQKELDVLNDKFAGIKMMTGLPEALFVVGISRHPTAVREARRKKVPIVAIVDTDDDPSQIEWPIPANDNSLGGTKLLLDKFAEVVEKVRKEPKKEMKEEKEDEAKTERKTKNKFEL